MGCNTEINVSIEYLTILICSAISIIGCLMIIFTYLFIPRLRIYSFRIVFYTAIADFLRAVCFIIPCNKLNNSIFIGIIAYLIHSSVLISIIWTVAISSTLYKIIINGVQKFEKDHTFWLIATCIVLLVNIVPIFLGNCGSVGTLCTFKDDPAGNWWRLLAFFIPMWIFILLLLVAYAKIYWHIRTFGLNDPQKAALKRLFVFPFLTIGMYLPFSLIKVVEIFIGECEYSVYYLVCIALFSLHGIFFSIGYCWSFNIKDQIKEMIMEKRQRKSPINSERTGSVNLLFNSFC